MAQDPNDQLLAPEEALNMAALAAGSPKVKRPASGRSQGSKRQREEKSLSQSPAKRARTAPTQPSALPRPRNSTKVSDAGARTSRGNGKLQRPSQTVAQTSNARPSKKTAGQMFELPSDDDRDVREHEGHGAAIVSPHTPPDLLVVNKVSPKRKRGRPPRTQPPISPKPTTKSTIVTDVGAKSSARKEATSHVTVEQDAVQNKERPAEPEANDVISSRESVPVNAYRSIRNRAFLGQDSTWEEIERAVKIQKKTRSSGKPKMKIVKDLIASIDEGLLKYNAISQQSQGQNLPEQEVEELMDCMDDVEEVVDQIVGEKPRNRAPEIVLDVYTCGILKMIELLKTAIQARQLHASSRPYDFRGLCEVVRIQSMTLKLCKGVMSWKVAPASSLPVTKSVKSSIFPYLRTMSAAFSAALDEEKVRQARRRNRELTLAQTSTAGDATTEMPEHDGHGNHSLRRSMAVERQKRIPWGRDNPRQSVEVFQPLTLEMSAEPDEHGWTPEQDLALKQQLLGNTRANRMKPQDRYLELLNHPLLQMKLPEHIEQRALYHKPFLAQACLDETGHVHWIIESICSTRAT